MKAAIYQGKEKIVIQDIPKPIPKKGEALIKVKYDLIKTLEKWF